jgi:hypothetical protein
MSMKKGAQYFIQRRFTTQNLFRYKQQVRITNQVGKNVATSNNNKSGNSNNSINKSKMKAIRLHVPRVMFAMALLSLSRQSFAEAAAAATVGIMISTTSILQALTMLSSSTPSATAFQMSPSSRMRVKWNGSSSAENLSKGFARGARHLLQYRYSSQDIDEQPILMQLANGSVAGTQGTIVTSSASAYLQMMEAKEDIQSAMDEYLEYVDKRYGHMKSTVQPVPKNNGANQGVSTITFHHPALSTDDYDQEGEDPPLQALGLSRLASPQLRYKLEKEQDERTTVMRIARYFSRFLRPFSYLCGAVAILLTFVRSNGYYS